MVIVLRSHLRMEEVFFTHDLKCSGHRDILLRRCSYITRPPSHDHGDESPYQIHKRGENPPMNYSLSSMDGMREKAVFRLQSVLSFRLKFAFKCSQTFPFTLEASDRHTDTRQSPGVKSRLMWSPTLHLRSQVQRSSIMASEI
jgi:hypothetical protein